jgi:photosystem II stability/assembly factor-like uncharacterized protein
VPWFTFGPDGGDARSFAVDPGDHTHLYLGTATGWIFESHNGGQKWSRLAFVGRRDDLVLDHIVVDAANPKHILVGAWRLGDRPDGGLFISKDGGVTWTSQPQLSRQAVLSLTASPSDPKLMVAGTLDGVFRSVDGGDRWKLISPPGDREIHNVQSVAIDPAAPDTIYAGTWHLPWKTVDGGEHWTNIKQGIIEDSDVFSIIVDPKQTNVVYASACSGIYKSSDRGEKFVKVEGIPTTARRTRVLRQDMTNLDTVFAGTTEGLFRTDSAGSKWTRTTGPDVIINDVYIDPTNPRHVLLATDRGGVLSSEDGGDSFIPSNEGFSARLIRAYAADSRNPNTLYVGVVNDKSWGGVFMSETGGLSWTQVSAGLNGRDVFSLGQAPDGAMLAGTGHGIFRLRDSVWEPVDSIAGSAFAPLPVAAKKKPVAVRKGPPLTPKQRAALASAARVKAARAAAPAVGFDGAVYSFALCANTLYAGTSQGLLRSVSGGTTWQTVAALATGEWRFLAAAKAYVLAASLTSVMLSTDGGNGWTQVTLPTDVTQVTAASVDGLGQVWVAGREGVYFSSNKGVTWQSSSSLYVRNVNSIFYDPIGDRVLITSNGPATVAFSVQLPQMKVSFWDTGWSLRFVRPVGDHLIAGTLFDGIVVQPRMVDSAETAAR